jgi:glycosyltransferase involved in cell wall biosynthesis
VAQLDDDTYLVLVGPKGWQIDELINDLARADDSKVITAGYVADEDLAPLYGGAIAFVYPSLYEGFGLPILEALQCGTPVIASDNSAIPEVVGDAGILVRADSRDELADAMLRVSGDAALRSTLVSAGLARSKHFSWQRCGDSTVQAYRDALQIPSRAPRPTRQRLDSSNKKLARSAIPGVERDGTRGGATSPS